MATFQYKGQGLRSVGAYQVSGVPFVTGSTTLGTGEVQMVEFPYVAKSFTVINTNTTSGDDIRVHFQSGSAAAITQPGETGCVDLVANPEVINGLHYITVPAGNASVTFDIKCTKFYVSQAARAADLSFQVFAELTGIPKGSMYHLTGSGITEL